jgi:putative ABC transport system permease protein
VKQGSDGKYIFLMTYDPDKPLFMDIADIDVIKGRWLDDRDDGKVLLGYNYQFDGKILPKGYEINDNIEVQGEKLRVVGFLSEIGSPPDDSSIYIISEYLDTLYLDENNSYSMIVAEVDTDNLERAISNIERNLRKNRNLEEGKEDFFVQSFDDLIESYASAMDMIIGFIILIALMSVFVSAVNTANTMITSVLERYKEIGVLKAIGAKNSEILGIFLFESAFLGFVAGVIGVIIGGGLSWVGGTVLDNLGWSFLAPHFSTSLFIGCILFATLTGALSGIAPAIRASKTNTVDALRYE